MLIMQINRLLGKTMPPDYFYLSKGIGLLKSHRSILNAHIAQKKYFSDSEIAGFGLGIPNQGLNGISRGPSGTLDDALSQDIENYMPGDILVKTDRASMAHGLELRAPFLDVELASFCIQLPYCLKINSKHEKLVLRKAFSHLWPEEIRSRNKQGFGAPVSLWLKRKSVAGLKARYLEDPGKMIYSIIPFAKASKYFGRDDYKTWVLLVLSLWLERHGASLKG